MCNAPGMHSLVEDPNNYKWVLDNADNYNSSNQPNNDQELIDKWKRENQMEFVNENNINQQRYIVLNINFNCYTKSPFNLFSQFNERNRMYYIFRSKWKVVYIF